MAFTRWDPLRDLLALHEQLGHLVGTDAPGWTPPVDLYETATEYVLKKAPCRVLLTAPPEAAPESAPESAAETSIAERSPIADRD